MSDKELIGKIEERLEALENWRTSLRGQDGIIVTNNVISYHPSAIIYPEVEVLETGCLNGTRAVGSALYRSQPQAL